MNDDIDQKQAALNEQINAQLADISQGITRIMAENERLRAALSEIEKRKQYEPNPGSEGEISSAFVRGYNTAASMRALVARAALAGPASSAAAAGIQAGAS